MFDAISAQRVRLADQFDGFTDDQWNTLSLCEGWRVRDVVGHLLSILAIPLGKFLLNVAKARSFDRYSDQVAREIGARDPQAIVAAFRAKVDTRFSPPIVGPIAPLTDIYVCTPATSNVRSGSHPSWMQPSCRRFSTMSAAARPVASYPHHAPPGCASRPPTSAGRSVPGPQSRAPARRS